MKLTIRIFLASLQVFLIALVGFAIYRIIEYRAFFRPTNFDEVALQNQIDQYEALYQKSINIPDMDAKLLDDLLEKLRVQNDGNEFKFESVCDYCDETASEKLRVISKKTPALEKHFTQFHVIVGDGLTIHLEPMDPLRGIPKEFDFISFRFLIYRMCESAALAALDGDSNKARLHFETAMKAAFGLYETPILINNMIGVATNKILAGALIHVAPMMKTEDLMELKNFLKQRPDPIIGLINTYRIMTLRLVTLFDQIMEGKKPEDKAELAAIQDYLPFEDFMKTKLNSWYLAREKLVTMNFYISVIDDYEKWQKNRGDPIPIHNPLDEKIQGFFQVASVPNLNNLTEKVLEAEALNVAVIRALEMELKRRKAEIKEPFVVEAGTYGRIEMELDHGCIVRTKKPKTE